VFVDEMIQGTFVSLRHVHEFIPQQGGTLMRDTLMCKSPFGVFGTIMDEVFFRQWREMNRSAVFRGHGHDRAHGCQRSRFCLRLLGTSRWGGCPNIRDIGSPGKG
jgi:hypothetical protein